MFELPVIGAMTTGGVTVPELDSRGEGHVSEALAVVAATARSSVSVIGPTHIFLPSPRLRYSRPLALTAAEAMVRVYPPNVTVVSVSVTAHVKGADTLGAGMAVTPTVADTPPMSSSRYMLQVVLRVRTTLIVRPLTFKERMNPPVPVVDP